MKVFILHLNVAQLLPLFTSISLGHVQLSGVFWRVSEHVYIVRIVQFTHKWFLQCKTIYI